MSTTPPIRAGRRLRWTLVAVALVGLVAWWGSGWGSSSRDGGVGRGAPAPDLGEGLNVKAGLDLYPRDERVPLPPVEGPTLDGERFTLSSLAGKVVVINVWGSWCGPCRAETPDLVRLANRYADRDVRFVGIDIRDDTAAAQAFARSFQVPYPSIEDPSGQLLLTLRDVVPTSVVPSTVVVDRRGRVAARVIGPVTHTTLKGILDDELRAEARGR